MKKLLVISAFLVACATSSDLEAKHFVDYRLASNLPLSSYKSLMQPRDITCTSVAGKICDSDCQRIWACVNNNGLLKPTLLETCKDEQTCNNGACSDVPTPECSPAGKLAFVCQTEGVFPDPITCKKYHYCIDNGDNTFEDFPRTCNINRSYNPRTSYCDKVLVNDQCAADYPVPLCKTPGQNAALKDNPSLYYVCSIYENEGDILYPYLYLCPDGQTYAGNYICK